MFVRGQVHLHFDSAVVARRAVGDAGFAPVRRHRVDERPVAPLRWDPAAGLVHMVEATAEKRGGAG